MNIWMKVHQYYIPSLKQMSCSHLHTCTHGLCRSGRQFPLSGFHSLLKTRCNEHAWHLKNHWLLFASVPPFRFILPLRLDKYEAFWKNINKTKCRKKAKDNVWKISLCGEGLILCWREGHRLQPFEKITHCQWIYKLYKNRYYSHMLLPRPLDGRLNLPGFRGNKIYWKYK